MRTEPNLDAATVAGFDDEWSRYDQSTLTQAELDELFDRYFGIFPWDALPADATGLDAGCGSGRWARMVAPRVGRLHCVDVSRRAVEVARRNLGEHPNCEVAHTSIDALPVPDRSLDFGYCLGVLHHLPDPAAGLAACVRKLRPGAPFLLYIYYAFDNRPLWYRGLWRMTDTARRGLSRAPTPLRAAATEMIAATVYWPLARTAALLRRAGTSIQNWPLAYYADASFYTMRTDALDRFGTPLEQRFTRKQIEQMMLTAGLERITFSNSMPYWCAVGFRSGRT